MLNLLMPHSETEWEKVSIKEAPVLHRITTVVPHRTAWRGNQEKAGCMDIAALTPPLNDTTWLAASVLAYMKQHRSW